MRHLHETHALGARPIQQIAEEAGIAEQFVEPYGRHRAKIDLHLLDELSERPRGRYVLVTAITPTPFGEGKTVTAIGLSMALNRLGHRSIVTLRQSSMGPTFGTKGGGAGGGMARLVPLDESLLHLTGDMHAVTQAHNLVAAMLDNSLYHGNPHRIDRDTIQLRRVLDVNDRALRHVTLTGSTGGERSTGFDITAASELMAILALVDGKGHRQVVADLRRRVGRVLLAFDVDGRPVTAQQIRTAGAASVLLVDALKPTLMQTSENTPALVHAGPFGNIAHGNGSIVADRLALGLADFVVTEAGFGADMGAEKFFDIKCRVSGLAPSAVVLVVTVRALKMHSGRFPIVKGDPSPIGLMVESPADVRAGGENLVRHIQNLQHFGVPVIVAINQFAEDKPSEVEAVRALALAAGAADVAATTAYVDGGEGTSELATKVRAACASPSHMSLLYPDGMPVRDKIEKIATTIYGAAGVSYSEIAHAQIARLQAAGFGELPVCIAKTHLSLSHNPTLVGAPTDFVLPIREVHVSAGAGFLYALAGNIVTMPGLGIEPRAVHIDLDDEGHAIGLV